MCGIFGYTGSWNAPQEILRGLQRLEYRGYDSAGLATIDGRSDTKLIKAVGRVVELRTIVDSLHLENYHTAIGHTRWATHGTVTKENCHPHTSHDRRFFVVHNGIIENYTELRTMLREKGHEFYGETDTEVVAKLFAEIYTGDIFSSLKALVRRIDGAYALVFIDSQSPGVVFGAKRWSPLVLGIGESETYVSSDYRSLDGMVQEYVALEDGDIFLIEGTRYTIMNDGIETMRDRSTIEAGERSSELQDFPHYMLKEIYEQPWVLRNVLAGRVRHDSHELTNPTLDDLTRRHWERVCIIASGTSYHAGLIGKWYLEELAGIETDVIVSTEFKYRRSFVTDKVLYMFISQSWETADTLESLKLVKQRGGYTFGIVNVPGSSIARLSEGGLYTHAGMEVGVASTKAFTGQIATLLLVALRLGISRDLPIVRYDEIIHQLLLLPDHMDRLLGDTDRVANLARKYSNFPNFFYLGRGLELPVAMEGSLKLKELTYHHAEAYSSGELKHGSIALIDKNFPVIMIDGDGPLHAKNTSSVVEVKSRHGQVIGITTKVSETDIYDDVLTFEPVIHELVPFVETILLQLFAYYMTVELGHDVDKPRNLAKSVTVE